MTASPRPLSNRIALITGASRGIGFATALELARTGAHVVAVARTVGGLEELDDAIRADGGTATLVPLDLKDYDGIARLAAALNERYGKLDILVCNGGVLGVLSPLTHVEPKLWDEVLAVNVTANWHVIRAFDPLLRASDAGRAVFVSSGVASSARAYWAPYSVSKAALEVLARTWAAEAASTPLRVNIFNPGATRTRMRAQAFPTEDPTTLKSPDAVAGKIVAMCLPAFQETGRLFDDRADRLLAYNPPS